MRTLLLGVILLIVLGIGGYFYNAIKESAGEEDEIVACTMDAMQCPDGSYVGRVPPSCEFAACPGPTQSDEDIEIIDVE